MNGDLSLLSTAWSLCSTILFGAILSVALVWAMLRWRFRRVYALVPKLMPCMKHYPLLGVIPQILRGNKGFTNLLLQRIRHNWGTIKRNYYMCIGPTCYIIIGDEDDVKTVLTSKKVTKSVEYDFFGVPTGLLTAKDDVHKQTRPHMNHLFTPRNVDRMLPGINRAGRNLVRHLSPHVGQGTVDLYEINGFVTLQSISSLLFGETLDIDQCSEELKGLQVAVDRFLTMVNMRAYSPWLWPEWVYNLYYAKVLRGHMNKIPEFFNIPIKDMLKEEDENGKESDDLKKKSRFSVKDSNNYIVKLKDAFHSLRNVAPEFSEQYLSDEIVTLVISGFHSSKALNAGILLALAAYPDVQERLYQEIVDVVGTGSEDITTEDLSRMTYLDMVVNEGLRKFTIVPLVFRSTKEDIQLSDMVVPGGAPLIVVLSLQNYDRELFPNADKFDPEHFSAENKAKFKKHSFTPFSQGSRNCIGIQYAVTLAKMMVVHVIRRFRLTTTQDVDNLNYVLSITVYSTDGYHVECHPRN